MTKKLSLYLFIDALGWEILERHPDFLKGVGSERRRLETVFGYSSACDPSIISGLLPNQHGLWSSFYYDPLHCPYRWLRWLRFLPSPLMNYHKVRHRLSKAIARLHGFTGYFQLYNVPFDRLPYLNYAEKRRIWEPGGLPGGESIFDRFAQANINYHIDDSGSEDARKLERAQALVQQGQIRVAYLLLGKLDGLMHGCGPNSPAVSELLSWYDGRIRELLETAKQHYDEVDWIVFSDHGMHQVSAHCDLKAQVEALGLDYGKDYVAVYDSTMARFWFLNEQARGRIRDLLEAIPIGTVMSDEELRGFGCYFSDHKYGECIFLMRPGIMLAPSDMGRRQIQGMHGFHPHDADSWAAAISARPLPENVSQIHHLFHVLTASAGL